MHTDNLEGVMRRQFSYGHLSAEEIEAITNFLFLWSFFEATRLNANASVGSILALCQKWQERNILKKEDFKRNLIHFQERYFPCGQESGLFSGLKFRRNDQRDLVISVLRNENSEPKDTVAALLMITYRLRNNLFHGVKWNRDINDQFDNFINANEIITTCLSFDAPLR